MINPTARTTIALITTWMLMGSALLQTSAQAHDVTVTLDGTGPITKTLIPAFGDINISDTGVFMVYPSPTPGPGKPGWDCTAIYGIPEDTTPDVPDEIKPHIKNQQPELEYGELPDSNVEVVGWDCVATFTEPIPWNPRFYCRDWTAIYQISGRIPVGSETFDVSFGDNGGVSTAFDLNNADLTISLILVGKRVANLGCEMLHPFDETIIYAADIHVGGLSGSVDVTLAAATPAMLGVTNSTIYVESINPDTIRLALDRNSVSVDTVTNNKVDELLLAGGGALGPLPGVPLVLGVASLAWVNDDEVVDLLLDFATSLYGFASNDCNNTEDCIVDVVEGLINQRIDLDMDFALFEVHGGINTGSVIDSGKVLSDLTERINEAIAMPLSWTTNVGSSGLGFNVSAELSSLDSSRANNTLTTTWAVSVTNTVSGSCANGLTGFVAPVAGTPSAVSGDIDFTVPFSLVGEAAQAALRQVNYCTNYNFGPFSGNFTPNGPLTVSRGGPTRIDLSLPAIVSASGSNSTGTLTLDITLQTTPGVSTRGDIELELTTMYITNLTGVINTALFPGVPATYNFGPGGAFVTTPFGTTPAPNIGPTIQTNVNGALGRYFPIPIAQRTTVYVAPHVYLQGDGLIVNSGSFSLGIDIKDGSTPVDVSVARIEGAAPYTDTATVIGTIRKLPLWAIIKNRDEWNVAPPTDVTIALGVTSQLYWLPPLQPGEEYAVPFTVYIALDSNGEVILAPSVVVTADILGNDPILALTGQSTINDPNRENNVFELTINDAWFQPDYKVEIASVETLLAMEQHGQIITNYSVESADFTAVVRVRNIGGESAAGNLMRRLNGYVNDTFYSGIYIGSLDIGEAVEAVLQFNVPEGPSALDCSYKFMAELVAGDKKAGNDRDYLTIEVQSSQCVGGGPTDADVKWIEENALDVLDSKFEGLNQVTWGTDKHGTSDSGLYSGPNAPIFDRLEPLP